MYPICQGVSQPGKRKRKSASSLKVRSIFTFVECVRTVSLFLNLRLLRLASWMLPGDLDEPGEGSAWRCPT
jgi:hypothetical protein